MKQVITLMVLIVYVSTMTGCAGLSRTADPEDVYQDIDDVMSCESIKYELTDINEEIQELLDKKKTRVSSNLGLAIIGGFIFWPVFLLMDLSDVEKIEIEALRERNKVLTQIAHEKGCDDVPPITASERQLVRKSQNDKVLEITR